MFTVVQSLPKGISIEMRETMERALDITETKLKKGITIEPMGLTTFTTKHIKEMVPLKHTGPEGCGLIALFYDHWPEDGEELNAYNAKLLDNTNPDPLQLFTCDTCKLLIKDSNELRALRPEEYRG
jgi:hypothetical protein